MLKSDPIKLRAKVPLNLIAQHRWCWKLWQQWGSWACVWLLECWIFLSSSYFSVTYHKDFNKTKPLEISPSTKQQIAALSHVNYFENRLGRFLFVACWNNFHNQMTLYQDLVKICTMSINLALPNQKKIGVFSALSWISFSLSYPSLLLLFYWEINSPFQSVWEPGWE